MREPDSASVKLLELAHSLFAPINRPIRNLLSPGAKARLVTFGSAEPPGGTSQKTQDDLGRPNGRRASSRRLGGGISPSRCACFRAALRARRMASAFSRALRSDGFS